MQMETMDYSNYIYKRRIKFSFWFICCFWTIGMGVFNQGKAQCEKGADCDILNMDELIYLLDIPEDLDTFYLYVPMVKGEEGNFYFYKKHLPEMEKNTYIFCQLEEYMPILETKTCPGRNGCDRFTFILIIGKDKVTIIILDSFMNEFIYKRKEIRKRQKERIKENDK